MADGFVLPGNDPLLTETTLLALVCGSQIAGASSEEPDELQSSLADGLRQAALALLRFVLCRTPQYGTIRQMRKQIP